MASPNDISHAIQLAPSPTHNPCVAYGAQLVKSSLPCIQTKKLCDKFKPRLDWLIQPGRALVMSVTQAFFHLVNLRTSPQAVQIIFTRVRFGTHRRGTLEKVSKRMKLLERTFFLFSDNHFLYADKNVSDNAVRYANPRTGPSSALAHVPNFQRKYDVTHFCAFPRHVMWSGNFV